MKKFIIALLISVASISFADEKNIIDSISDNNRLQKLNEFSEWKIATGLEHTVKYLKPVLPNTTYRVIGEVYEENLWKNPKYTQLKMNNALIDANNLDLVLLSTNFCK